MLSKIQRINSGSMKHGMQRNTKSRNQAAASLTVSVRNITATYSGTRPIGCASGYLIKIERKVLMADVRDDHESAG
jgi:hypothetical protein